VIPVVSKHEFITVPMILIPVCESMMLVVKVCVEISIYHGLRYQHRGFRLNLSLMFINSEPFPCIYSIIWKASYGKEHVSARRFLARTNPKGERIFSCPVLPKLFTTITGHLRGGFALVLPAWLLWLCLPVLRLRRYGGKLPSMERPQGKASADMPTVLRIQADLRRDMQSHSHQSQ